MDEIETTVQFNNVCVNCVLLNNFERKGKKGKLILLFKKIREAGHMAD